MKRVPWSLLFVSGESSRPIKRVRIRQSLLVVMVIVITGGSIGLGRSLYFSVRYASAVMGLRAEQKKNSNLMRIFTFLRGLSNQQVERVEQLVAFEDKARQKYGLNEISDDVRQAGVGGEPSLEERILASLSDPQTMRVDSLSRVMSSLIRRCKLQDATFRSLEEYASRERNRWSQRPSIWPVRGRLTSGFGYRFHPLIKRRMFHEGIDIANEPWTPIVSTADGVVSHSGYQPDYGNMVVVDHYGNGYKTVYAHLQQSAVTEGLPVSRGDVIGYLGNTGRSTGPHLHYEVRYLGRFVNPFNYILPTDMVVD